MANRLDEEDADFADDLLARAVRNMEDRNERRHGYPWRGVWTDQTENVGLLRRTG